MYNPHTHTIKPSGLQLGELQQGFLLCLFPYCSFLLCVCCPRLSTALLGPDCQSQALMRQCQLFVWLSTNESLNRKSAWEGTRDKLKEIEDGHSAMFEYWEIIFHLSLLLLASVSLTGLSLSRPLSLKYSLCQFGLVADYWCNHSHFRWSDRRKGLQIILTAPESPSPEDGGQQQLLIFVLNIFYL